ncbi:peptidyl-tRNA hydrolase [Mobilicoccus caccae]|uniref:peptidyl-tRNA hydrolase n=1 Tax=Mobilicoccus caccae TaxID=1859295 RepID=A0ABQ6IMI4_9MICO|nr:peptidyl-tRNA hydrolase [Mobilicoccus caccae]GMA37972.1 hypothetical protein GCM10025883_00170 [Mobilicoccus caccae]GMA42355.1 hypothetical protein GCM10025883_44000 [Mobilicoccus caccae]GMA42503.1 hypothetical protein GCM10025883_45480 [Mobilicoccus caccae]
MSIGEVLTPVRERYAHWLGLDAVEVERDGREDPEEVRALQLILRLERDGSPDRATALALAATGCALLCLDERSAPGGPWHAEVDAYCRGHIRKVTRRARGARWEASADLPGLSFEQGDTQIRVLVPGRVGDLDKRVSVMQVGGTEIPPVDPDDDTPAPAADPATTPHEGPHLRCVVPASLEMTAGKLMAQTGHAGMIAAALAAETDPDLLRRWFEADCPAVAEVADERCWRDLLASLQDPAVAWTEHRRLAVRDAGYTEVDPGTITVVATLEKG